MDEETFCSSMPKAELHAHLSGSLTIPTLLELVQLHKANFPDEEIPVEATKFSKMLDENKGLDATYEIFRVAQSVVDHPAAVKLATRRVIEEFCEDSVKYLELRSTPREVSGKMTKEEYIMAVVSAIEESKKTLPILTKLLISIDRRNKIKDAEDALNFCTKMNFLYPSVVVGIDLSGDARVNDAEIYLPLLQKASSQGLKVTVHLAEIPNDREVESFLSNGWIPNRIGHGTCLHPKYGGSKESWEKFLSLKAKIPVEICISSNHVTESADKSKHHIQEMWTNGIDVIICTDDKGVFNCTLSSEYVKAMNLLKLTRSELYELSLKSLNHIFATCDERNALAKIWRDWKAENIKEF